MGCHRSLLDRRIQDAVNGDGIDWLEPGFHMSTPWLDAEIKGLNSLKKDHPARIAWKECSPQGCGIHNWDAAGAVQIGHVEELVADCGATSFTSRHKIERTFDETRKTLGPPEDRNWLHGRHRFWKRAADFSFPNTYGIVVQSLHEHFLCGGHHPRRIGPACRRGLYAGNMLRCRSVRGWIPAAAVHSPPIHSDRLATGLRTGNDEKWSRPYE